MEERQVVQEEQAPRDWKLTMKLAIGGFILFAIVLLIAGTNFPTSVFFGFISAIACGWSGPELLSPLLEMLPKGRKLPQLPRGEVPETEQLEPVLSLTTTTRKFDEKDEELFSFTDNNDDLEMYRGSSLYIFSQVMKSFTPSLQVIYLATLESGNFVYSDAKGLCHIAIAGSTGQGKSTVLRLILCQLCYAGASCLLLNPHYTRYDIENDEDWTPFEPYLIHDPMECHKYEAIEHYLAQVATVLLPKRLEKYAHSQPVGKPYFLILEELPAIIAQIPEAPKHISAILREGRKVGIFLITASQDFLVKTIAPQGGGAIRDCYRTAYYVGGDSTTARVLLDLPASQVQEERLGKGTVMLRSKTLKQAQLAHVPYVDNQSLYDLLGPSTYIPGEASKSDDSFLENISPRSIDTSVLMPSFPMAMRQSSKTALLPEREEIWSNPVTTSKPSQTLPTHLQETLDILTQENIPLSDLAKRLGVSKTTAHRYVEELKARRKLGGMERSIES